MARFLDVYLNTDLVGQLEQDNSGTLRFRYDASWLGSNKAFPLSVSLPLQDAPFNRRECRPFFAGLLPEETQRELVAGAFGISKQNDFALLDKIGGECAGAVSLMQPGEQPNAAGWSTKALSLDDLEHRILELPRKPLLAGQQGLRLSLAGAQSKMALVVEDGGYGIPLYGAPSTHIIKPQSLHFSHLVENEFFCMKLASDVGLNAAQVEIGQAVKERFLQIKRYDRSPSQDGEYERIHQEDFCQALSYAPELKYQQEGGPGLKQLFELIRRVSAAPAVDVLQLFDVVTFNCLIGNGDAHGKNFSLLYSKAGTRLAPFYDLLCTHAYPELDRCFAMKIGKERDPGKIRKSDWLALISETGLNATAALKRMAGLTKKVHSALLRCTDPCLGNQQVINAIRGNVDRMRRTLGFDTL
jgi:serine/threonine-protein kinase HipA